MRLNKTQKETIVSNYTNTIMSTEVKRILGEINKELKKISLLHFQEAMELTEKFDMSLREIVQIPVTMETVVRLSVKSKQEDKFNKYLKHLVQFNTDKDKGFYLPLNASLKNRLENIAANVARGYPYNEYVYFTLDKAYLHPRDGVQLTVDFNANYAKKLVKLIKELTEYLDDGYKHIQEIEQLVHSVTTDNKLLELLPDFAEFIPYHKPVTDIVPIAVINEAKKRLNK